MVWWASTTYTPKHVDVDDFNMLMVGSLVDLDENINVRILPIASMYGIFTHIYHKNIIYIYIYYISTKCKVNIPYINPIGAGSLS